MALEKTIKFDNVKTNYHRIIRIESTINEDINILVGSYTNEQRRDNEIELNELKSKSVEELTDVELDRIHNPENTYIHYSDYMLDYKEDLTIEEAYDYLKTLEIFKDAKDI